MRLALLRLALALVWLLLALPARADEARTLVDHPRLELPLLAIGAGLWTPSDFFKPQLAPRKCRLCGDNPLDDAMQKALLWDQRHDKAAAASDWLLYGIVPVATFGATLALGAAAEGGGGAFVNAVTLAEALVLTSGLTQIAKYTVARARPYVRLQREQNRDFVAGPDDHLSFFSGHTSSTFAMAVAAGTTASLRGQSMQAVVWPVGLTLACLTGYLRMAADRHYFTDVLTGALVGGLVGALVPFLHARQRRDVEVAPSAAPR